MLGSPSVLPSLRSSSVQFQISPLSSSALTPTQVLRTPFTRIESAAEEGMERETAEVVGWKEGPSVMDDSGVWSASCRMKHNVSLWFPRRLLHYTAS